MWPELSMNGKAAQCHVRAPLQLPIARALCPFPTATTSRHLMHQRNTHQIDLISNQSLPIAHTAVEHASESRLRPPAIGNRLPPRPTISPSAMRQRLRAKSQLVQSPS